MNSHLFYLSLLRGAGVSTTLLNPPIMSYIKFDRHANMSSETRREILDIIGEVDFNTGFDLINMLYGLFDGYLYDDLLPVVTKHPDQILYNRVKKVVLTIKKYPKING